MTFHEKLKKLMAQQHLSQDDLAKMLEVSQNLVSLWTRGKSLPDIQEAAKIGRVLGGIDLNYLIDDEVEEPPAEPPVLPRDQQAIIDLYVAVGISQKEALKRLAGPGASEVRSDDSEDVKSL